MGMNTVVEEALMVRRLVVAMANSLVLMDNRLEVMVSRLVIMGSKLATSKPTNMEEVMHKMVPVEAMIMAKPVVVEVVQCNSLMG